MPGKRIFGKVPLSTFRKELSRVKSPVQLAAHASQYSSGRAKEIAEIIRTQEPKRIGKYTVYFCDFIDPKLRKDTGFASGKIMFLDKKIYSNMPEKFLRFVLQHELREELLMLAGYSARHNPRGSIVHRISIKKEFQDLQRAGLLKEYLEMLRENFPQAFKERAARWKINPITLQPEKRQKKGNSLPNQKERTLTGQGRLSRIGKEL